MSGLSDFKQPAHKWIASAIDEISRAMDKGVNDPSVQIEVKGGVVFEFRVIEIPGHFETHRFSLSMEETE